MNKVDILRKKYPKFVYEKYFYQVSDSTSSPQAGNNLEIFFDFKIEPNICFKPKIVIENVTPKLIKRMGDRVLNNLVFNLGLMEIPSYWKATCSPIIEIRAGYLNKEQIKWWKDLIMNGMGQFFYENKIDFQKPNFITISSTKDYAAGSRRDYAAGSRKDEILVPVGGGKDSVVTLESLKRTLGRSHTGEAGKANRCFSLNPTEAAQKIMKIGGCEKPIIVRRKIDKKLLELNQKGFLNGHTPFSAYLAFLSVLVGVLYDYKNIAFSNEKSADEGNVKYLGRIINHQWSKSSEFEKKFRIYCKKYLAKNINYFSFLRKYTELEIAKMFTKYPQYFSVFSSCNAGQKIGKKWCGNCPKCLFVYVILYPFLDEKKLIQIFGKNLFEDKNLLPLMRQLTGDRGFKPFECVGTYKESREAFELSFEKAKKTGKIPYLLAPH